MKEVAREREFKCTSCHKNVKESVWNFKLFMCVACAEFWYDKQTV